MSDQDVLRQELVDDPEGLGYAALVAAGDHSAVLDLLNKQDIAGKRSVPIANLQEHLMEKGLWFGFRNDPGLVGAFTNDLVNSRLQNVDLQLASAQAVLAQAETDGLVTAAQRAAIEALGDALVSRAEQLIGRQASITDVRGAV